MPDAQARQTEGTGRGIFGQDFAPESEAGRLIQLISPQREAGRRRVTQEIGDLTRTRGLSGAQEAELFSRAERFDLDALAQAGIQAEQFEAQATARERLIDESRRFDIEVEQERIEAERAAAIEQLIGGIFKAAAGPVGLALGAKDIAAIFQDIIRGGNGLGGGETLDLSTLPEIPAF